jgi:hypothetical protein
MHANGQPPHILCSNHDEAGVPGGFIALDCDC